MALFTPKPLFQQIAEELYRKITAGEFGDLLPGEETLSSRLGVSRPTLRQALQELSHQGVIAIAKGKRTRIVQTEGGLGTLNRPPRLLVVGARPAEKLSRSPVLEALKAALEERQWSWSEHSLDPRSSAPKTHSNLRKLWEKSRADALLLIGSTPDMQAWAMRERIPALVLGSLAPGVSLPSVDVHYYALGWHAGGRFAAAGRTRISVFVRSPLRMGDIATLKGLRDFCASTSRGMTVAEVAVQGSAFSLVQQFEKILKIPAAHGWFFIFPQDSITAYTSLLSSGRAIPAEVSLISRETFPWIEAMVPSLAHYRVNHRRLVKIATTQLENLARGVTLGQRPSVVLPQFVPGQTLPSISQTG